MRVSVAERSGRAGRAVVAPVSKRVLGPKLPPGVTPEAMARQALALRAELGSNDAAADKLGIARQSATMMMDIVRVADRTDLSERDAGLARVALAEMNGRLASLRDIHARIAPIRERLWGSERSSISRERSELMQLERFDRAMGVILQGCNNAAEVDVPQLTPERVKKMQRDVRRAISSMQTLLRRIGEVHR